MDFIKKYPLTAREAVCTPMILHDGFFKNCALPFPSLNGIRDFTEYCGISYSAVRTSLSRLHHDGFIKIFRDDKNVTRYQMTESSMAMGNATIDRQNQPDGFIIAIFSFTKNDEKERACVRETLKYYGFKKLAQNTYINGRIETESLKKSMREFGLEKNLYLFNCPNIDDNELIEKILSVFEIEKRNKILHEFYEELKLFLSVEELTTDEIIHRLYYSGPIHWNFCFMDEPPFPLKFLPKDYPLFDLIKFHAEFLKKHYEEFMEHFIKVNK